MKSDVVSATLIFCVEVSPVFGQEIVSLRCLKIDVAPATLYRCLKIGKFFGQIKLENFFVGRLAPTRESGGHFFLKKLFEKNF